MAIELTQDQQRQIDQAGRHPIDVHDPHSKRDYVLLPADEYDQMRSIVEEDVEQRSLRRAGARSLARRLADEAE